jgi:perosamine synthetase
MQLVLCGFDARMKFFYTHISPRAIELAVETLQSKHVGDGEQVIQFEEELARNLGISHPVAVNSCTSALHLALVIAGAGPGDEVILPAQTFIGSAFTILMCGAKPVFSDIQPNTGNMDPASLRRQITPRTKAVMPVHWGGYPCDMDEINGVAAEHDLAVVEDAAHALGATYHGHPIGAVSRFTAFSFGNIKYLTTGDGGVLCCLSDEDCHQARCKRWFGVDRERERREGSSVSLDSIGFKYHMNNLTASVGLGNLPDVHGNLKRQRAIAQTYRERLQNVPGLTHFECRSDREGAYWLFSILVEQRDSFIRALADRGVPAQIVERRIDGNQVFGGFRDDLTGQAFFEPRQVSLPVNAALTDEEVEQVIAAVRAGW